MSAGLLLIRLVAIAATAGCAAPIATRPPWPPLQDGSATVALGRHAVIGPIDIVPLRIEEDSRCPTGVQCVWAGRVRVAVSIADHGEIASFPILLTLGEPLPMENGGGLTLVAVCPYPVHPNAIARDAYRLVLAIGVHAPPRASDFAC